MNKRYILVVRDRISIGRDRTDIDLRNLNCYYESSVFEWDGTLSSLNLIIDNYQKSFSKFIDWTAEVIPA